MKIVTATSHDKSEQLSEQGFFTTWLLQWNKYENQQSDALEEMRRILTKYGSVKLFYSKPVYSREWNIITGSLELFRLYNISPMLKKARYLKLWEGLGYYSRCRNIITSARYITNELDSKFPVKFNDILQLKGIGNYTASAIASFAYNLPYAVLDGNVFRVLSRFFGIHSAIDSNDGKRILLACCQ